jgi:hypothetical protein
MTVGFLSALYTHILFIDVPVLVEVRFVGEPNVMNDCWSVFQILTKCSTKGDSTVFVNIGEGFYHLDFVGKHLHVLSNND